MVGENSERCAKHKDVEIFAGPGDGEGFTFRLGVSLFHVGECPATELYYLSFLCEDCADTDWAGVRVDLGRLCLVEKRQGAGFAQGLFECI